MSTAARRSPWWTSRWCWRASAATSPCTRATTSRWWRRRLNEAGHRRLVWVAHQWSTIDARATDVPADRRCSAAAGRRRPRPATAPMSTPRAAAVPAEPRAAGARRRQCDHHRVCDRRTRLSSTLRPATTLSAAFPGIAPHVALRDVDGWACGAAALPGARSGYLKYLRLTRREMSPRPPSNGACRIAAAKRNRSQSAQPRPRAAGRAAAHPLRRPRRRALRILERMLVRLLARQRCWSVDAHRLARRCARRRSSSGCASESPASARREIDDSQARTCGIEDIVNAVQDSARTARASPHERSHAARNRK